MSERSPGLLLLPKQLNWEGMKNVIWDDCPGLEISTLKPNYDAMHPGSSSEGLIRFNCSIK